MNARRAPARPGNASAAASAAGAAPAYWQRAKRQLARNDAVLGAIMRSYPRACLVSRGDPFQTLARSIVGQQISVKAADAIWGRLLGTLGTVTPERSLSAGDERLLACGLSRRKVEYVRDLAAQFGSGRLDPSRWKAMDDEEVIEALTRVRGIGRWTAEMFLIFNLLRPDVLPVDDLGLRRAASLHYRNGRALGDAALHRIARDWRPWRSVATWYLWRSLDPVPVEY